MNTETINETIHVCKYLGLERKIKMLEGEVILPDIKPDILSIVKVSGKVCIHAIKPDEDKIHIEGAVHIYVLYIADDEWNSQKGVNYEIDFSESIAFHGVTESSIVKLKYEVGNIEYKAVNGRKITIKAPLSFYIKVFQNCDISIVRGITNDEDMEIQKTNCPICSRIITGNTIVDVKETIQLEENNTPIGEILDCEWNIVNQEYKLSYNKILAKADMAIKIVYSADNENQNLETFISTIPLMGIIDIEGIDDTKTIKLDYLLRNFAIKPVYQDLQANSISVETAVEVNAFIYEKNEVEFITDFYTPNAILKMEKDTHCILKNMLDIDEKIELSQMLAVPELENTRIYNISGNASLNEKNILNGKIAITGIANVDILYARVGNHLMECKKIELPFQQVIKKEEIHQNMEPMIHLELEEIKYANAGENQLQVGVVMKISVLADEEETTDSISKLEVIDEPVPIMPSVVVYYVKSGDTLWNIAKRFQNKVAYIKEFNELKDDTLYPGQRLLIPRYVKNNVVTSIM